jgi:large subunit ribosomal protein L29
MKPTVIKDLSTSEVNERLLEEKSTYAKLKLSHAVSSIENPLKIRATRRTIARLQTELNNRQA